MHTSRSHLRFTYRSYNLATLVMNIYNSFIDPEFSLDRKTKKQIHKLAWKQWFKNSTNMAIYATGLATSMGIFIFLPDIIDSFLGNHFWYHTVSAFIIYIALLAILFHFMRHFRFAPCVYAELRTRGFDVCPKCGYNLKDLTPEIQTCPECGRQREFLDS